MYGHTLMQQNYDKKKTANRWREQNEITDSFVGFKFFFKKKMKTNKFNITKSAQIVRVVTCIIITR